MRKPLILITNDDGITAPGIIALVEAMRSIGKVVVVAPDSPQSSMGHAITLGEPLRLEKVDLFKNIVEAFPKTSEVALVRLGEKPVGGGLILSFKDTVYMPSASSLRSHFHLCPNNLLYWEVIKRACDSGYPTFDFGRSTVGSGTYHFKKQWGAAVTSLHWQYVLLDGKKMPRLNPSNPRFKVFIEIWKRLPVRIATSLGSRITRGLP